jgi:hypothetical protein
MMMMMAAAFMDWSKKKKKVFLCLHDDDHICFAAQARFLKPRWMPSPRLASLLHFKCHKSSLTSTSSFFSFIYFLFNGVLGVDACLVYEISLFSSSRDFFGEKKRFSQI